MIATKRAPPRNQKKFRTIWGELLYVCGKVHYWLYGQHDRAAARRYLDRLGRILDHLPSDDSAILREEGCALFHELTGENAIAARHRRKEIRLMERLHESVRKSVESGDYDERMGASVLQGRDADALSERRAILRTLESLNGKSNGRHRKKK